MGATITALVSFELAIRGHLSPGGGFAAGVAGGTAIGLIAITSSSEWMEGIYHKWNAATWEKISVLIFIVLAVITLIGIELPHGQLGTLFSGGIIPILNILVAIKVALGSWGGDSVIYSLSWLVVNEFFVSEIALSNRFQAKLLV